ncbi:MAG TPA: pseudouridine synthase [Clostridia bacterium]|nr:pseudouridine synthase [Clostridia bacterium]
MESNTKKNAPIKLSAPATHEFWEIPVLFEDEHLLALDKPAGLASSPDRLQVDLPNLATLLHNGIAEGKPWARERNLTYLMPAHRLDADASGVLLLAKTKPALIELVNLFNSEQPCRVCVALVAGQPEQESFEVDAKIAPHPDRPGEIRVDSRNGKKARTRFTVLERLGRWTLLRCEPLAERPQQIRAHLQYVRLPVLGDALHGGKPLWLSRLKPDYQLKPHDTERPLMGRAAVHEERVLLTHPVTSQSLEIESPWPKDLRVSMKYLRRYGVK